MLRAALAFALCVGLELGTWLTPSSVQIWFQRTRIFSSVIKPFPSSPNLLTKVGLILSKSSFVNKRMQWCFLPSLFQTGKSAFLLLLITLVSIPQCSGSHPSDISNLNLHASINTKAWVFVQNVFFGFFSGFWRAGIAESPPLVTSPRGKIASIFPLLCEFFDSFFAPTLLVIAIARSRRKNLTFKQNDRAHTRAVYDARWRGTILLFFEN